MVWPGQLHADRSARRPAEAGAAAAEVCAGSACAEVAAHPHPVRHGLVQNDGLLRQKLLQFPDHPFTIQGARMCLAPGPLDSGVPIALDLFADAGPPHGGAVAL